MSKYPFNLLDKPVQAPREDNRSQASLPRREERLDEDEWPKGITLTDSEHEPNRIKINVGLITDLAISIYREGEIVAGICLDEQRARRLRLFLDDYLDRHQQKESE